MTKVSAGFVPLLVGLGWCLSPGAVCDVPMSAGNRVTQPSMAKSDRLSPPWSLVSSGHKHFFGDPWGTLRASVSLLASHPPHHGHQAMLTACLQSRKENEKMSKAFI